MRPLTLLLLLLYSCYYQRSYRSGGNSSSAVDPPEAPRSDRNTSREKARGRNHAEPWRMKWAWAGGGGGGAVSFRRTQTLQTIRIHDLLLKTISIWILQQSTNLLWVPEPLESTICGWHASDQCESQTTLFPDPRKLESWLWLRCKWRQITKIAPWWLAMLVGGTWTKPKSQRDVFCHFA